MKKKIKTEQIESGKELLISILKSAPHGIVTLKSIRDQSGSIIDFELVMVNRKFEELFDIENVNLLGKRFYDLFPRTHWEKEFDLFLSQSMKGEYIRIEKDLEVMGNKRSFQVNGIHFDEALTLHFMDITDLKNSINALRENELKYRVLFDESIDPIFVMNENFIIIDFNIPFSDQFGFDKSERGNITIQDLLKDKKQVKSFTSQLKNNLKVKGMELVIPDTDNVNRDYMIHCAQVLKQNYDLNIYIGGIRDMTETKMAEREMIFAEKMATTGKLARIIAHELRNPLTNINLALMELEDEMKSINKEAGYYFDMIKRNTRRIETLTRNFLNSSKLKSLNFEKRDINQIIGESLELVRDRLELKKMILKERLVTGLPKLNIDPDQLKVGLLNLFLNAVEAMEPGKGVLEVSTNKRDQKVTIHIRDNGKGIPQKDLENVFDPFYTGKKEGTGLGLTVTRNIINGHHGNILVESSPGKGTTFIISLPVS
jgi:PAS domain S-box-containing protein